MKITMEILKRCTKVILTLSVIACSGGFDEAKRELEKDLKDPATTQYRNMIKSHRGVICGEFNTKNSMGGYVGFEPFIYLPFDKDIPNTGKISKGLGSDFYKRTCE